MLEAMRDDRLSWHCQGGAEDEQCGTTCECGIDEVEYRGGIIILPPCSACGARCSLKADYTLKELSRVVQAVKNERSVIWSFVLPLRYVRNLRLHWMLYERGKAEHAPVLPMPAPELLARPEMAEIDSDVVYAMWFGYLTVKYKKGQINGTSDQPAIARIATEIDRPRG